MFKWVVIRGGGGGGGGGGGPGVLDLVLVLDPQGVIGTTGRFKNKG
jgi:hypothetical protein